MRANDSPWWHTDVVARAMVTVVVGSVVVLVVAYEMMVVVWDGGGWHARKV